MDIPHLWGDRRMWTDMMPSPENDLNCITFQLSNSGRLHSS
jgi:hypothetical protein